jgi:hypothetical protein
LHLHGLQLLLRFLAWGEKGEKPEIYILDTTAQRIKRRLQFADANFNEFVCMAFAPGQENKYFISATGKPDCTLHYWIIDTMKPKVTSSIRVQSNNDIHECGFNPNDPNIVTYLSYRYFRAFKLLEFGLKQIVAQVASPSQVSQVFHV